MRAATMSAAHAGMPSTTIRCRLLPATSITPTIIAISKPPNAASTSTGSVTSLWRPCAPCSTASRCDRSASSMSGPEMSRSDRFAPDRRDSTSAALSCEPTPMPAQTTALPTSESAISMPARIAACAWSSDIAEVTRALRVPCAILRASSRACGATDSDTPQSTTDSSSPWMRANTATGSCEVSNWCASSAVDWLPATPKPSTARPWSAAKIAICGVRKRGFSVFWINPRRTASASSSPRPPVVSARRASFWRRACSSSGFEVAAMSERLTDMGVRGFATRELWGRGAVGRNRRASNARSAQEQPVHRVVGFVLARVGQALEEFLETLLVLARHLDADQDAAVVRALVAVVEQADVPARVHARQEAHQRAGAFGEDEAVQPLVLREAAAAADHVAHVLLRELVAGQVERVETVALEVLAELAGLGTVRRRQADEHVRDLCIRDAVVELGHCARADQFAKAPEAAALLGDRHREQCLALLADLGALGDEAQAVEVHVGAAGDRDEGLALAALRLHVLLDRRDAERARGFEHAAGVLEHVLDRGAGRVGVDDHVLVDELARQAEGL